MSKIKLDFKYECKNSVITFNGLDNGVNKITVSIENFGEDVSLDNSIAVVAILKPSGKVYSQFGEVEGSKVVLNLEGASTDEVGIYTAKLLLVNGDKRKITRSFKYEVEQENILSQILNDVVESSEYPLLTDMLSRLSTIENDEEQRKLNEAQRILNEDARLEAENSRVEAELIREHNDADREKTEAVRGTNENNRVKAEKLRSANEDVRVGAENSRVEAENLRVEAENLRNDNYNFMTGDEARRRSNEDARVEAEAERVKVEANRVAEESKRRTVETARVKAEDSRVKAETSRVGAEVKRVEAETSRVEAEKVRSSRYETLIGEAEKSVQNFNSYASSAKLEEAERSNNENSRVEAEKLRSSNEATRINGEKVRVENEQLRVEKEVTRNNVFDAKVVEVNSKINEVNTAKNTMVADTKKAIDKMTNDFNSLSASQQQDAEVVLARDGEESLNARLERDLFIGDKSLKQEVIDLGGLKESQDMAYTTDKGYLVCKETKNGTIKDLKISGKSSLNLCPSFEINYTASSDFDGFQFVAQSCDAGAPRKILQDIEPNTQYTIMCNVINMGDSGNYRINNPDVSSAFPEVLDCKTGINIFHVTSKAELTSTQSKALRCQNRNCRGNVYIKDIMILKGHIQSPPSYFEGIASVGSGVDEIEVSSMNNGNILNSELIKAGVNGDTGKLSMSSSGSGTVTQQEIIPVVPNMKLYYKSIGERTFRGGGNTFLYKYGANNEYLGRDTCITFNPIDIPSNCYGVRVAFTDFELSKDYPADKYGVVFSQFENFVDTPVKQDKKPVLFKDVDGNWKPIAELRGLDTVCDTIELHSNGKYYYHVRTNTVKLLGNEVVSAYSHESIPSDRIGFTISVKSVSDSMYYAGTQLNVGLSDKFNVNGLYSTITATNGYALTVHSNGHVYITLPRSLNILTNEECVSWLQSNTPNIIYQLAEEKIFEVNPLFLEAFEGETMMLINSGVINAPLDLKIASYITSLVLLNQQRISMLEDQVMGMFKSVLSGDMRTLAETLYPQDFVFSDDEIMLLNKL